MMREYHVRFRERLGGNPRPTRPGAVSPELKGAVAQKLGVSQGGASSLLSLLSAGKGLTTMGGFGAVNQFGANYLGTGLPGLSGSLTSTSLTSILGGAGIGAGIGALNLLTLR